MKNILFVLILFNCLACSQTSTTMSKEEAMQTFQRISSPGENHAILKELAGSWKAKSSFWISPEARPENSTAYVNRRMILGGRFLQEEYNDLSMDKPFKGVGMIGYDNATNEFNYSWFDTMSTGTTNSKGTYNKTNNALMFTGENFCPFTNEKFTYESKLTMIDSNTNKYEMFKEGPDGKMFKALEVFYTKG